MYGRNNCRAILAGNIAECMATIRVDGNIARQHCREIFRAIRNFSCSSKRPLRVKERQHTLENLKKNLYSLENWLPMWL